MDTGFVICYKLICPFFEVISAYPSLPRGYRQPRVPNATESWSWLSNNQPRRLVRPRNSDIRRVRLVIVIIIIIIHSVQCKHSTHTRALVTVLRLKLQESFRFVKKKRAQKP